MPHRGQLTREEKRKKKEEELRRGIEKFEEPPELEQIPGLFQAPGGEIKAGFRPGSPGAIQAAREKEDLRLQLEQERLVEITQQTGVLTPEQKEQARLRAEAEVQPEGFLAGNIELKQAISAGLAEAGTVGGIAVAAGLPVALATAPATAGVSFVALGGAAFAGTVAGFVHGAYSNIKSQQTGKVKAQTLPVKQGVTQLNNIVSAVNVGADPTEAQAIYTQVVLNIFEGWSELQAQTRGDLRAFNDGTAELERYEIFFNPEGGTLVTINLKMNQAIINPNPSKISTQTIEAFDEED